MYYNFDYKIFVCFHPAASDFVKKWNNANNLGLSCFYVSMPAFNSVVHKSGEKKESKIQVAVKPDVLIKFDKGNGICLSHWRAACGLEPFKELKIQDIDLPYVQQLSCVIKWSFKELLDPTNEKLFKRFQPICNRLVDWLRFYILIRFHAFQEKSVRSIVQTLLCSSPTRLTGLVVLVYRASGGLTHHSES